METRFKLRVSRLFRSSFHSCKSGNPVANVQEPVFLANRGDDLLPLLPRHEKTATLGFPLGVATGWGCIPRRLPALVAVSTVTTSTSDSDFDMSISSEDTRSLTEFLNMVETRKAMLEARAKASESCECEDQSSDDGRTSSCVSPSVVPTAYFSSIDNNDAHHVGKNDEKEEFSGKVTQMEKKKKKKLRMMTNKKDQRKNSYSVRRRTHSRDSNLISTSSSDTGWFSSQEDRERVDDKEKEAALSSKNGLSESSEHLVDGSSCVGSSSNTLHRRPRRRRGRKEGKTNRPQLLPNASCSCSSSSSSASCCCCPCGPEVPYTVNQKVKESVAVVMRSTDPYSDFRESMVEMIIEKQIFDHEDLKHLLHCFLSLNSQQHHPIIVDVFAEICDALFSV